MPKRIRILAENGKKDALYLTCQMGGILTRLWKLSSEQTTLDKLSNQQCFSFN